MTGSVQKHLPHLHRAFAQLGISYMWGISRLSTLYLGTACCAHGLALIDHPQREREVGEVHAIDRPKIDWLLGVVLPVRVEVDPCNFSTPRNTPKKRYTRADTSRYVFLAGYIRAHKFSRCQSRKCLKLDLANLVSCQIAEYPTTRPSSALLSGTTSTLKATRGAFIEEMPSSPPILQLMALSA